MPQGASSAFSVMTDLLPAGVSWMAAERQELDAVRTGAESARADVRALALLVIDDEDGTVPELDHGRIGADELVYDDRSVPRRPVIRAPVQRSVRKAVGQQQNARPRPEQVRAVAREAEGPRDAPGPPAVARHRRAHRGCGLPLDRQERPVAPRDDVGLRVELVAPVRDVDDRAPRLPAVGARHHGPPAL